MASRDPPDDTEWEEIVFGRRIEWGTDDSLGTVRFGSGENRPFPAISLSTVKRLIEAGYLDREATHNDSPSVGELVAWAENVQKEYPDLLIAFTGFMVSPQRSDSRVRLEGFELSMPRELPEALITEVESRFSPDLFASEQTSLELWWD